MDFEKIRIDAINKAANYIINGTAKLIKIDEHTSTFIHRGKTFNVWIANGVDSCGLYRTNIGTESIQKFDENLQEEIFKLATTPTAKMHRIKLKELREKKKETYEKYKKVVNNLKTAKKEYDEFKETLKFDKLFN